MPLNVISIQFTAIDIVVIATKLWQLAGSIPMRVYIKFNSGPIVLIVLLRCASNEYIRGPR